MEVFEATLRVKPTLDSSFINKSSHVTVTSVSATAPETFEWVQHGDASARRRARAHVTRGFRRQKAEAAKLAKTKTAAANLPIGPSPDTVQAEKVVEKRKSPPALKEDANRKTGSPFSQNVEGAKPTMQDFILVKTIGSGKTDPFNSLPIKLDANGHAILEHFLFGLAPVSYNLDSKSDFSPVKSLSFQVSLNEAAAFHMIMAVGAGDLAVLQGKKASEMSLKHRGISIKLINERLMNGDTSDGSIAAIALIAGSELLYGTPRSFNTHMRGLAEILKIRGGLETLRKSNPPLYSWISWVDYAACCSFVRMRSLLPPSRSKSRLYSDPLGCPAALLDSLPEGYDLFEYVNKTFRLWEVMITIMSNLDSAAKMQELALFIRQTDTILYHSLCLPNLKDNKGRWQYIKQCLQIFSLICGAVFARVGGNVGDVLFTRLEVVFNGEARRFVGLFGDLCHELLNGAQFDDESLHIRSAGILDACGLWAWDEWRVLKGSLLEFFLEDAICVGPLQTVWIHRMEHLSR